MRRLVIAAAAGLIAVAAAAAIPMTGPAADTVQTAILLPGFLAAAIFWPQGAHSRAGAQDWEVTAMFAVTYAVSFLVWTAAAWGVQALWSRRRTRTV